MEHCTNRIDPGHWTTCPRETLSKSGVPIKHDVVGILYEGGQSILSLAEVFYVHEETVRQILRCYMSVIRISLSFIERTLNE